ncbi:hypothetical protein BH09VER1_BH09VER1_13160 [soil metagenome]
MTTPSLFSPAKWIASSLVGSPRAGVPAPYVRQSFSIDREVAQATLHITALGLYECEINGRRIGDHVFAPGWTDYGKRVPFQTYDVTSLLQQGENAIGAILGDGWYCGFVAWRERQLYGDRPRLLARLEIYFADGGSQTIASDDTWKTAPSPVLANDLLQGESYDARLEEVGWSQAGFDDSAWQKVVVMPDAEIAIEPSPAPPVRRRGELEATALNEPIHGGPRLFDFQQNFSGRVRVTVTAPRGTTLTLRHVEVLNPDGTIYTENLRSARATDHYTCAGIESETWEPRFTFHGFRYVEIAGLAKDDKLEVTGIVLYSDMAPTGSFACSHQMLNQLQHNIVWGQKSNFLEIPTDCPQRDERLGWTGDAQVFVRTAAFNMDVQGFFKKWAGDVRDAQLENGGVPPVAPDANFLGVVGGQPDGGPAWADAAIICPWTIYLCYGDTTILEESYASMRKYMDFMAGHRCRNFIRSHPEVDPWGGFGDWLALDGSGKTEGGTPRDLIGTAFYAYDAEIMSNIAAVLGKGNEAETFRELHEKIVAAFRRRFVTPEGLMASGTQTAYVLALHFGLIPEEASETAAKELVRDIEKRNYHLATGFVGTPYLLEVLENHGHLGVAYKLLEQETFPSWLFPIKNGATTIWERWDGWTPEKGFQDKGMNSFNHYAYGAVGAWMYRSVAGLELDLHEPGYRHIIFRPRPGGTITWAEAQLETPQGRAGIRWDLKAESLEMSLTVPEGSRATLSPPAGFSAREMEFGPGSHRVVAMR